MAKVKKQPIVSFAVPNELLAQIHQIAAVERNGLSATARRLLAKAIDAEQAAKVAATK